LYYLLNKYAQIMHFAFAFYVSNKCRLSAVFLVLLSIFWGCPSYADDRFHFDIAAQRADKALILFAKTTNIPVLFPSEEIWNIKTNALRGNYTVQQGLVVLLKDTGLVVTYKKSNQLVVKNTKSPKKSLIDSEQKPATEKKLLDKFSAFLSSVFSTSPKSTQDQEDNGEPALEEIVVTAQRREQNLQNVPVSMTTFFKPQLAQNHISNVKDYFLFTPNVSFTEDGETGERSVGLSMRGVSDFSNTLSGIIGVSNSFGIYIDEFNVASIATKVANPQLQDLERIEILRGPQGTYFGRNATGGALNLTTVLPENEFSYEFGTGYASFDTWETSMIVNAPITDNFYARGVLWYEQSDGFIRNQNDTGTDAGYEHYNGRAAFRWLVNDKFTIDFSAMRTRSNDGAAATVNSGVLDSDTPESTPNVLPIIPGSSVYAPIATLVPVDTTDGSGFYSANTRYVDKDFKERNKSTVNIFNARLNYESDHWSLRSITGWIDSTLRRRFDQDVTGYGVFETNSARFGESFSQEIRFNFSNEVWNITLGGLYAEDELMNSGQVDIGPDGFFTATLTPSGGIDNCIFCLAPGDTLTGSQTNLYEVSSYALFTDASWRINEQIELIAGVRYTHDRLKVADYKGLTPSIFHDLVFSGKLPPVSELDNSGTSSFGNLSPRFVVNYSANENVNAYFSISAGYKPGGKQLANRDTATGSVFTAVPYDDEKIWNYEGGIKLQAFDKRLQVNAAAFYMEWIGLQVPTVDAEISPGGAFSNAQIVNADAHTTGFELELRAVVGSSLFVGAGVGYLRARFDGFRHDEPYVFEDMAFELDGETLPRAPEWTLSMVGQYDFTLMNSLKSFIRLEWSYRSETSSDIEAVISQLTPLAIPGFNSSISNNGINIAYPRPDFPFRVPSFDIFNLRAEITGERWSITAYVENLLNKQYYTGTQENFGLGGIRLRPHHRMMGVNFRLFSN
jgi:iron complex outermembrane recepter protein